MAQGPRDGGAGAATTTAWSQPRTEAKRGSAADAATTRGATEGATTRTSRAWIAATSLSTERQVSQGTAALIAHVVLFRLRPEVSIEDRRALIDAWASALREIPMIRRARVGRRVRIGRSYESLTSIDLPFAAVLEFDNVDALRAYLDHPAHEAIAVRLFAAVADALIYDFEVTGDAEGLRAMLSDT